MVGHQDVGVQPKAVAAPVVLQTFQIVGAISVVVEDGLAVVAAGKDMVAGTGKLDAGFASHEARVAAFTQKSRFMPDTFLPGITVNSVTDAHALLWHLYWP